MVAEKLVILQFGVVERVLTEDDASVGWRRWSTTNGHHDGLFHVLRFTPLQPLQCRTVAAVGRVAEHHHLLLPPVAPITPRFTYRTAPVNITISDTNLGSGRFYNWPSMVRSFFFYWLVVPFMINYQINYAAAIQMTQFYVVR